MENPINEPIIGHVVRNRTRVLKDGTIKVYQYTEQYVKKTENIHCDKAKIKKRFNACKDRAAIQAISEILTNAGY